ncbi:hypothetical protein DFP73DRAFT_141981 [Morchella snyderi]|nr:hypothetical protein DFP73DRAFT_141981 [Morchella snyderi]
MIPSKKGVIGAERLSRVVIPKPEVRHKEISGFPFLLPSSLCGLESPLAYSSSIFSQPSKIITDNTTNTSNMGSGFRFSATSEPFTPVETRPCTPAPPAHADPTAVSRLQNELLETSFHVNSLTGNLRECQEDLRAKSAENKRLRSYIHTLEVLNSRQPPALVSLQTSISSTPPPSSLVALGRVATNGTTKPDNFFKEEFGMLFREIHNFGKGFYKFATDVDIPSELAGTVKDIVGDERMLRDIHTKLLIVAGIVMRFVCLDVFRDGETPEMWEEQTASLTVTASEKHSTKSAALAMKIHTFILPLMSRPGDQKHCEESFRLLEALISHAFRVGIDRDNWRFSFPSRGARFVNATMVPCDTRNLGFSGEQERDNGSLENEGRGVLFCVLPCIEKRGAKGWGVVVKASVRV